MSRVVFEVDESHSNQMRGIKFISVLSLIISLIAIILVVGFLICKVNFTIVNSNVDSNADKVENLTKLSLNIVSREEWGAANSSSSLDDLILPIEKVIIAQSTTSECFTKESCAAAVLNIQKIHTGNEFRFNDIAYNFLIGGDGNVYEGRGWLKQGAHTSGYNRISLGVVFIGNYVLKVPNDLQLAAANALFEEGIRVGALRSDYKINGACQLRSTESPGKAFFELIKTWDHWSSN